MDELEDNKRFVNRHISDSSGWSYRQAILQNMAIHSLSNNVHSCYEAEATWTLDLVAFYPPHESLWVHLRLLFMLDLQITKGLTSEFSAILNSIRTLQTSEQQRYFFKYLSKFSGLEASGSIFVLPE